MPSTNTSALTTLQKFGKTLCCIVLRTTTLYDLHLLDKLYRPSYLYKPPPPPISALIVRAVPEVPTTDALEIAALEAP